MVSWNEFQKLNKGRSVTTAEWKEYNRRRQGPGGLQTSLPSGRQHLGGAVYEDGGSSANSLGALAKFAYQPSKQGSGVDLPRGSVLGSDSGTGAESITDPFACFDYGH